MKILVYFPTNARAIDQISVMEMFIKSGHEVYLLTQTEKGNLHYLSEKLGVKTYSYSIRKTNPFSFYIKHAFFLIKFCHHHRIDIIFSHLHDTGITCVLAKPFLKARTFFVRHNTDEGKLLSPKKSFVINLIINTFSTNIIAPSKA
ncbi:MAG: glycosyltransferase, partial [Deltaproteobacteria bacterium]|nr:glycosyltransferase [Deltaproteobacteria bacterium]